MSVVYPPVRFGRVEEDVYRGSYPTLRNYEFLRGKGLKTMIAIVPEILKDLKRFCEYTNVKLKHLKCEAYRGSDRVPSSEIVSKALEMIVDTENLPVYVFCCDGGHVVGTICASLRRLQNWRFTSALLEYKRYSKSRSTAEMMTQFMEIYAGPIKLKRKRPRWLWNGASYAQHPQIRCIQESSELNGKKDTTIYEDPRAADFDEVLALKNQYNGGASSDSDDAIMSVVTSSIKSKMSLSSSNKETPQSPRRSHQHHQVTTRGMSKFETKTMNKSSENREYEALGIIL
jgi:tyrosine-protein phosphatase OCA6